MGCPDWPKCFGLLAPPTCACQLPANYQDVFLQMRIAKVERFANMLSKIGLDEKAKMIRTDRTIYRPEEFNVAKAWIEYINRIFGIFAGLAMFWFAIQAFRLRKIKNVFLFAILALIMLVLNAWLGSIVVATNLLSGIVTIHFLLSFMCIFFLLLSLNSLAPFQQKNFGKSEKQLMIVFFILIMIELVLGTFARERIDLLKQSSVLLAANAEMNLDAMGIQFAIHRYLPGLIFLFSMFAYFKFKKQNSGNPFKVLAAIVFLQICFGAINIVYLLPPWSQVFHIVFGSFLPCYAFYYCLTSVKIINLN